MDELFFEQVIIKLLFNNEMIRNKVLPYLTIELFEDFNSKEIVKKIMEYGEQYNKFPSVADMRLFLEIESVYTNLVEYINIDDSEFTPEFLIDQIEEFIRGRLIHNTIIETVGHLKENNQDGITASPDILRDSICFSFKDPEGISVLEDIDDFYKFLMSKDNVIPSNIKTLDNILNGGFHEKSLSLFMGEPGMGKSLVMCSLATNFLLQNKNVLYISLELSQYKIAERIYANIFDVPVNDLKMVPKTKIDELYAQCRGRVESNLVVKEYSPYSLTAGGIRNMLKDLEGKKKFKPDVILIDYLGLMKSVFNRKGDNEYSELKRITQECRGIGVDFGIPVISAMQTNREAFGKVDVGMGNVSDSIGTVQGADILISITQNDEFKKMGKYFWTILKNRFNVMTNQRMIIDVDYGRMRIMDAHEEDCNPPTQTNTGSLDQASSELSTFLKTNDQKSIEKQFMDFA